MSVDEKIRFWIMIAIFIACYWLMFRGFIRLVLHNVRMIRAKIRHLRETAKAATEVMKRLEERAAK